MVTESETEGLSKELSRHGRLRTRTETKKAFPGAEAERRTLAVGCKGPRKQDDDGWKATVD